MISSYISEFAILSALGFVGYQLLKLEKTIKKNEGSEDKSEQTLRLVRESRFDMAKVLAEVKHEISRFEKMILKSENLISEVNLTRLELRDEGDRAAKLLDELKESARAADRTCNRISDVMAHAAERYRKMTAEDERIISESRPIPIRKASIKLKKAPVVDNVVLFNRSA